MLLKQAKHLKINTQMVCGNKLMFVGVKLSECKVTNYYLATSTKSSLSQEELQHVWSVGQIKYFIF